MLYPSDFDNIPQPFDELYQELETFILQDVSRRIKKAGEISSTAKYQLETANLLNMKNVESKIAEILKLSKDKVDKLFPQIANMSIEQENEIYKKAGLDTVQLKDSKTLQKYLSTAIETTKGDLENITRTLGFAEVQNGKVVYSDLTKFYRKELSLANMQISTGAIDYNTAIRQAVKKISESGVRQINYESGRSNEVYAAARRAVLTSTSQMSQEITNHNIQKLVPNESDRYVEVSAHANARLGNGVGNHQAWQGRCYRVVGSEKDYPNLVESTGLGMAIGLLGIACRHSYMPFFPGISKRNYTEEELKNINTPDFEYEGKKYNGYEATQHQREIERNIRQLKRELICYKETGLEEDFKIASSKLNAMNREYKKFSQASGIRPKNERTQQEGFNRSISKQATNAAKQREIEIAQQKELDNVTNVIQEAAATKRK